MDTHSSAEVVSSLVRTHDHDRYLTALFAPAESRTALMALFAFNCELDRIPWLVSEPALGEIRLQWWRDVLADTNKNTITGNPVADEVTVVVNDHKLARPMLQGMIDARSADLDGGGFADMQALRAYLYKTHGALFALSAKVLGHSGADVDRVANQAGLAFGLARTLVRLPFDAASGRVMMPLSLLHEHNVLPEQVLAGENSEAMRSLIAELVAQTRKSLDTARGQVAGLPRAARQAFAVLVLVEPMLRKLNKPGVRVLEDVTELNPLARFFRLGRASWLGKV